MNSPDVKAKRHSGMVPEPKQALGAGYLYHYDPIYQEYATRLEQVGGRADLYELLGVQFNAHPDEIETFAASLGKPVALHSFEYCIGNVQRPAQAVLDRVQTLARLSKSVFIGEHMGIMGTRNNYIGGFFQPPGTDEQTQVMIDNLKAAKATSYCPFIVENPSQFYNQIGPKSIGTQLREISEGADVGILLSLSNISISDRFHPQDREAFLAEIPLERVRELHILCNNAAEERMPGMEKTRQEQEWAISMMQQLAKRPELRPASVVFELEAGTPSMAEPERLRDFMELARDLFFRSNKALNVEAA
jgi:uncharacterized protein (UPF0276 family)